MPPLINRTEEEQAATYDEPLTCSVYAPTEFAPGDTVLVQIWLHTDWQSEEVAPRAAESDAGARRCAAKHIGEEIPRGARLRFQLKAGEIPVEGQDASEMTWGGRTDSINFVLNVPEGSQPSRQACAVTVYMEEMPLARLMFLVRIKGEERKAAEEPALPNPVRYRTAYLCYARQDRPQVLRCAQGISKAGVSVFQDSLTLEAGEDWMAQVYHMIDMADVFCLFWSEAAARSEEVRREVLYALERQKNSPDALPEIIPIVLSLPMPPPPGELASLHFDNSLTYLIMAEESLKEKRPPKN